jgi:hypothetical protein
MLSLAHPRRKSVEPEQTVFHPTPLPLGGVISIFEEHSIVASLGQSQGTAARHASSKVAMQLIGVLC